MRIAPSSVHHFLSRNETSGLKKLDVDVTTIDDFVNQRNLKIDFIFMDAEGSEKNIIEGMRKTLNNNKHLEIITEFNPHTFNLTGTTGKEFLDICDEFNFEYFVINEKNASLSTISRKKLLEMKYPSYVNIYLKRKL